MTEIRSRILQRIVTHLEQLVHADQTGNHEESRRRLLKIRDLVNQDERLTGRQHPIRQDLDHWLRTEP